MPPARGSTAIVPDMNSHVRPQPLAHQVAVVTGASRGIGAHIAQRYASAGAQVACVARTLREGGNALLGGSLEETVQTIQDRGGEAIAIEANLADPASYEQIVGAAHDAFGRIDILVNNAAVGFFGPTVDLAPSRWNLSWRVTVDAPLRLSQLVLPEMLARGSGRIINLTSEAAIGPGRGPYGPEAIDIGDVAYGMQKAAVERLTQGLARETYDRGVGVVALAPSQIVPTPGALFNAHLSSTDDPAAEDPAIICDAAMALATAPLDEITGRIVYSQQLLTERGELRGGTGYGVDPRLPVSGFSQR